MINNESRLLFLFLLLGLVKLVLHISVCSFYYHYFPFYMRQHVYNWNLVVLVPKKVKIIRKLKGQ
jgi:uncharacterized membrane protein